MATDVAVGAVAYVEVASWVAQREGHTVVRAAAASQAAPMATWQLTRCILEESKFLQSFYVVRIYYVLRSSYEARTYGTTL